MQDMLSGEDIWENAKHTARKDRTEYWIFSEPIHGDAWDRYGPYKDPAEAKRDFESLPHSYDGAGTVMERITPPVGVEGRDLVYGADREAYAGWGEETPYSDTLKECSTQVATRLWDYVRHDDGSGEGY